MQTDIETIIHQIRQRRLAENLRRRDEALTVREENLRRREEEFHRREEALRCFTEDQNRLQVQLRIGKEDLLRKEEDDRRLLEDERRQQENDRRQKEDRKRLQDEEHWRKELHLRALEENLTKEQFNKILLEDQRRKKELEIVQIEDAKRNLENQFFQEKKYDLLLKVDEFLDISKILSYQQPTTPLSPVPPPDLSPTLPPVLPPDLSPTLPPVPSSDLSPPPPPVPSPDLSPPPYPIRTLQEPSFQPPTIPDLPPPYSLTQSIWNIPPPPYPGYSLQESWKSTSYVPPEYGVDNNFPVPIQPSPLKEFSYLSEEEMLQQVLIQSQLESEKKPKTEEELLEEVVRRSLFEQGEDMTIKNNISLVKGSAQTQQIMGSQIQGNVPIEPLQISSQNPTQSLEIPVKILPQPQSQSHIQIQIQQQTQMISKTKVEVDTQMKTQTQTQPQTEPQTQPQTEPQTQMLTEIKEPGKHQSNHYSKGKVHDKDDSKDDIFDDEFFDLIQDEKKKQIHSQSQASPSPKKQKQGHAQAKLSQQQLLSQSLPQSQSQPKPQQLQSQPQSQSQLQLQSQTKQQQLQLNPQEQLQSQSQPQSHQKPNTIKQKSKSQQGQPQLKPPTQRLSTGSLLQSNSQKIVSLKPKPYKSNIVQGNNEKLDTLTHRTGSVPEEAKDNTKTFHNPTPDNSTPISSPLIAATDIEWVILEEALSNPMLKKENTSPIQIINNALGIKQVTTGKEGETTPEPQKEGITRSQTEFFHSLRVTTIKNREDNNAIYLNKILPGILQLTKDTQSPFSHLTSLTESVGDVIKNRVWTNADTWNTCSSCTAFFDRFDSTFNCRLCLGLFCIKCGVDNIKFSPLLLGIDADKEDELAVKACSKCNQIISSLKQREEFNNIKKSSASSPILEYYKQAHALKQSIQDQIQSLSQLSTNTYLTREEYMTLGALGYKKLNLQFSRYEKLKANVQGLIQGTKQLTAQPHSSYLRQLNMFNLEMQLRKQFFSPYITKFKLEFSGEQNVKHEERM